MPFKTRTIRRNKISRNKPREIYKTFDFSSRTDDFLEPAVFTTFENSEQLPDDWYDSRLYYGLCRNTLDIAVIRKEIIEMKQQEPRTDESLKKGIERALGILECLMIDMLGTRGDTQHFREVFQSIDLNTYEKVCGKCEKVINTMEHTVEILKSIRIREKTLEEMKESRGSAKECIKVLCEMNKKVRGLIEMWLGDGEIPFDSFVFRGRNYLEKIEEDKLVIQEYLDDRKYTGV